MMKRAYLLLILLLVAFGEVTLLLVPATVVSEVMVQG